MTGSCARWWEWGQGWIGKGSSSFSSCEYALCNKRRDLGKGNGIPGCWELPVLIGVQRNAFFSGIVHRYLVTIALLYSEHVTQCFRTNLGVLPNGNQISALFLVRSCVLSKSWFPHIYKVGLIPQSPGIAETLNEMYVKCLAQGLACGKPSRKSG